MWFIYGEDEQYRHFYSERSGPDDFWWFRGISDGMPDPYNSPIKRYQSRREAVSDLEPAARSWLKSEFEDVGHLMIRTAIIRVGDEISLVNHIFSSGKIVVFRVVSAGQILVDK